MTENGVVSSGATPALAGLLEMEGVEDSKAIDPVVPYHLVINHLRHHLPIIAMLHAHHLDGRHRVGPGGQPPLMCYLTPRASCPVAHDPCLCLGLTQTQASSGLGLGSCVPVHLQAFSVHAKEIVKKQLLKQYYSS